MFLLGQVYDAHSGRIKLVEVINSNRLWWNASCQTLVFSGSTGKVGVDARDVQIAIRLTVHDINASGRATPYLLFGEGSFTVPASNSGLRITGGDLYQSNRAQIVAISEAENPIFQGNVRSDGTEIRARTMQGSFDFIDRVVQSFVPESFDNKWYTYYPDYEANFSISIEFEGKTSGTFYYSDSYELDEFVLGWVTVGKFRTRIDSRDPNKVHITMTGEDLYVFEDDDIVVSGTIEEVILELELPFGGGIL